jgi:hypothetical protein
MDMVIKWFNKVKEFFAIISESDFDYGFVSGVLFALGIVVLFLIVKLIFRIIFRVRKTKLIVVKPKDGDGQIIIETSAVESAIREEISKIHSVFINKIKIYRNKRAYFLLINCNYDGKDGNLMSIRNVVKERIDIIFKEFFGVKNLKKIDVAFSRVAYNGNDGEVAIQEVQLSDNAEVEKGDSVEDTTTINE